VFSVDSLASLSIKKTDWRSQTAIIPRGIHCELWGEGNHDLDEIHHKFAYRPVLDRHFAAPNTSLLSRRLQTFQ
jgi:hypothetical protein